MEGAAMSLPSTLPTLPPPQIGHFFPDHHEARHRALQLNEAVLDAARRELAEAYQRVHALRARLVDPLPGLHSPANGTTASILGALLDGLLVLDADTCGAARSEIDEAALWNEVPDEDDRPICSWSGDVAPMTTMRASGR
jgi:hypothetical protein